ncbi:MAG: nitrogen fixation protein NifA, partial [Bdellovibrionaceae bacterium]|nr:nitrogen fixation protein NifA [Pseudobdellovibrionaceae bacterium]
MINWDEFEHIHVIRKLKQILGAWWNIDVIFTDECGQIRGFDQEKTQFSNPAVAMLMQKETAKSSIGEMVSKTIDDLRTSQNRYSLRKWDMVGFDVGIFPILIQNDFVGTVVATGFFREQTAAPRLEEIRERLAAFGMSADTIDKCLSKLKYLEEQDRLHFCEVCELVAQEIVTLHLEITSREDRIKELNKELGNRFKYDNMIGKSKPMQSLYSLMDKIKTADSTV